MAKSRIETITDAIVASGKPTALRTAWQYLRSESAKAEAEMINVSHQAQNDIVSTIGMLKPKKFAEYKTDKTMNEVKSILGKMISDSEILARRMVSANFIAGKVRTAEQSNLSGQQAVNFIALNNADRKRIDDMVVKVVGNIQRGASLTQSSVQNMLTNTAIRANQIVAPSIGKAPETKDDKENKNKKKSESRDNPEQVPMPMNVEQEPVKQKRANKIYKDVPLTEKELEELKKRPITFANNQAKSNVSFVTNLRNEYIKETTNPANTADDKKERELAKKEANGNINAQAVFNLNKSLQTNGLYAFFDKGGKRWTLESYCAMSTRTMASQSSNLGEVFADTEHDLYYIVPHAGSCPLCKKYEGRVYSRSGKDKRYPPLSTAFKKIDPNGSDDLDNTYMSIHPNCRHKIVRYIEQNQTKYQARKIRNESNRPFELTKKQEQEIYIQKQREREWNERQSAMREFQMYLQVLPPRDVCGNFLAFYEHKKANDNKYKEIKQKYSAVINGRYNVNKVQKR